MSDIIIFYWHFFPYFVLFLLVIHLSHPIEVSLSHSVTLPFSPPFLCARIHFLFFFPFGTQSSAFPSQSAMQMLENSEKTPDEKPSPEQNRHPSRGSNLPLFTNETRTIIWGLQARAVQVVLHEEVILQQIVIIIVVVNNNINNNAGSNNITNLKKYIYIYNKTTLKKRRKVI